MPASIPPRAPDTRKPSRRLRRTLAAGVCLLLSPLIAFAIWSRVEAGRLNRALDVLEARGEPLDVNALDPRPATAEQREASHLYAEAGKLVGDVQARRLVTAGTTIEELCALPPGHAGRAARLEALREVEAPHERALDLLERASGLDAAGWDDADRPQRYALAALGPRNASLVNVVRVARLACTGEGEAGAAALLASLRLRRVLPVPWFAVPLQTTHSLQALLTSSSPSAATLKTLQQEYERGADEQAVEKQLLYSRAMWLSLALPGEFSDPPAGFFDRRIGPVEAAVTALFRPARDRAIRDDLAEFDQALAAARQPWPAKFEAAAALSRKHPPSSAAGPARRGLFAALSRPFGGLQAGRSINGTVAAAAEALAGARASIAAIAIARYQRGHAGALPRTLAGLVPDYLAAPPVDPYTGGELRYRQEGARYKVYAVGLDRTDDGGVWDLRSDVKTARRGAPKDVGIAVGAWHGAAVR
jgi:hypothetical protein